MRVKLFIVGEIESFSEKPGGAHKSVLLLASELIKGGHNTSIILFGRNKKEHKITFNQAEVIVRECKVNKLAFSLITPFIFSMYKMIKNEEKNTDIFHFYSVQLDPLAGLYKTLNKDKKVISTLNNYYYIIPYFSCIFQDKDGLRYRYNFLQKHLVFFESLKENYSCIKIVLLAPLIPIMSFFYSINTFLSKKIKNYTAVSKAVKEIYELNGFENIKIVPNMYDSSFINEEKKEKEKIVLCVGRIKKYKGIENLILAFKKSDLNSKGYVLKIAGSGSQLTYLKNEYENDDIVFLGNIPYKNIREEYAKAEIFVHPGLWPDPFPRTSLEAMQSGCKMLVSNIGEPPNTVKKEECIYQYDDIDELAKKLENLTLGKEIGVVDKKVLENYSPQRVIKIYEKIYEEM